MRRENVREIWEKFSCQYLSHITQSLLNGSKEEHWQPRKDVHNSNFEPDGLLHALSQSLYVCITTNQPDTKSNPNPNPNHNHNPNPTTKQNAIVSIQLVTCF